MAVMDVVGVKPGRVAEASGGRFVTFEGPEGAGKTTQIARLRARLESNGQSVLVTREPGGTPLGGALRSLMLDTGQIPLAPIAQALLMSADRAQHVASVIRPALQDGTVVISDRYVDSLYAYQGFGDGVDLASLKAISLLATDGLLPDLTILLDLEPSLGLARKRQAHEKGVSELNTMERRPIEFHQRVRGGFKELAVADPTRFVVLDATAPAEILEWRIWRSVDAMIRVR